MEKLVMRFAEMSGDENKMSDEFLEVTGKLGEYNDEDLDCYIASQENFFRHSTMMFRMLERPPGTKLDTAFLLGEPGTMPPVTMTKEMNEESVRMRKRYGPTFDRECPDFCDEYLRTVGIPEGLDREWTRKLLYRSFVDVRLLPWSMLGMWRMLGEKTGYALKSSHNKI